MLRGSMSARQEPRLQPPCLKFYMAYASKHCKAFKTCSHSHIMPLKACRNHCHYWKNSCLRDLHNSESPENFMHHRSFLAIAYWPIVHLWPQRCHIASFVCVCLLPEVQRKFCLDINSETKGWTAEVYSASFRLGKFSPRAADYQFPAELLWYELTVTFWEGRLFLSQILNNLCRYCCMGQQLQSLHCDMCYTESCYHLDGRMFCEARFLA